MLVNVAPLSRLKNTQCPGRSPGSTAVNRRTSELRENWVRATPVLLVSRISRTLAAMPVGAVPRDRAPPSTVAALYPFELLAVGLTAAVSPVLGVPPVIEVA